MTLNSLATPPAPINPSRVARKYSLSTSLSANAQRSCPILEDENFVLRPAVRSAAWGGFAGKTCQAPAQKFVVEFIRPEPGTPGEVNFTFVGLSPISQPGDVVATLSALDANGLVLTSNVDLFEIVEPRSRAVDEYDLIVAENGTFEEGTDYDIVGYAEVDGGRVPFVFSAGSQG